MVTEMQARGATPVAGGAQQLTPDMLASADLVLVATRGHRTEVLEQYPGALHRTFTLLEFAALAPRVEADDLQDLVRGVAAIRSEGPAQVDIADPIGRDAEFYRTVADQIDDAVADVVEALTGGAEAAV